MGRRRSVNLLTWLVISGALLPMGHRVRDDRFQYGWDDRRTLCSISVDDPIHWPRVRKRMRQAKRDRSVLLLHAHKPGSSMSFATLEKLLSLADDDGLAYLTYDELVPSPRSPRAGLALSFDDADVQAWYGARDVLARHHAHVTFFVTQVAMLTEGEIEMLRELAAAGHAIEAHSSRHLHAKTYVAEHGVDAYVADEAVRSITDLKALGFAPTAYAYPYGEHVPAVDQALLDRHVQRTRVGPSSCPY